MTPNYYMICFWVAILRRGGKRIIDSSNRSQDQRSYHWADRRFEVPKPGLAHMCMRVSIGVMADYFWDVLGTNRSKSQQFAPKIGLPS